MLPTIVARIPTVLFMLFLCQCVSPDLFQHPVITGLSCTTTPSPDNYELFAVTRLQSVLESRYLSTSPKGVKSPPKLDHAGLVKSLRDQDKWRQDLFAGRYGRPDYDKMKAVDLNKICMNRGILTTDKLRPGWSAKSCDELRFVLRRYDDGRYSTVLEWLNTSSSTYNGKTVVGLKAIIENRIPNWFPNGTKSAGWSDFQACKSAREQQDVLITRLEALDRKEEVYVKNAAQAHEKGDIYFDISVKEIRKMLAARGFVGTLKASEEHRRLVALLHSYDDEIADLSDRIAVVALQAEARSAQHELEVQASEPEDDHRARVKPFYS